MNIDLLFTANGKAGLISSENQVLKIAGVVFDSHSGILTLEYVDMDFKELNIPVEASFNATLDMCPQIQIGAVKDGNIAQAYQVPFMVLDDPYRSEMFKNTPTPSNPLASFGHFIKSAVFGQPVHREDLGDDDSMGCILGDASPASLQFAPQLARRQAMEVQPNAAPSINAPGMGLGGSSSGGGGTYRAPPSDPEDDE